MRVGEIRESEAAAPRSCSLRRRCQPGQMMQRWWPERRIVHFGWSVGWEKRGYSGIVGKPQAREASPRLHFARHRVRSRRLGVDDAFR